MDDGWRCGKYVDGGGLQRRKGEASFVEAASLQRHRAHR